MACAGLPRPSEEEIRQQLGEVYARPEFSPTGANNWFRLFLEWLLHFFDWIAVVRAGSPLLFWLIVAGCVVLLMLIVAHLAWTIRRVLVFQAESRGRDALAARCERLSRAYWEQARECAAQQDYTEAIRYLFLSLVYRFDERGQVEFPEASTNREYLALFDDRPQVRAGLQVFVDTLDDNWYGQQPSYAGQYEACVQLYESLV
jgi:Domain of unknown function (DUF4129)